MSEEKGKKSILSSAGDRYGKNLLHGSPSPASAAHAVSKHKPTNTEETIKETEEEEEGSRKESSSFGLEKTIREAKDAVNETVEGLLSHLPRLNSENSKPDHDDTADNSSSWLSYSKFIKGLVGGREELLSTSPPSDSDSYSSDTKDPFNFHKDPFKFQKVNPWITTSQANAHTNKRAVRDLLTLIQISFPPQPPTISSDDDDDDDDDMEELFMAPLSHQETTAPTTASSSLSSPPHNHHRKRFVSHDSNNPPPDKSTTNNTAARFTASDAETASRLAEGTIRTLRDLALDEAVELHNSLRFWNERWERPLLGWIEAGPTQWFSHPGYRHQDTGQKVSQIQAVLARRCAAIGELQQHLIRAGWSRGVAQWGVLGQWTAVAGGDGLMEEESFPFMNNPSSSPERQQKVSLNRSASLETLPHATTVGASFILDDNANIDIHDNNHEEEETKFIFTADKFNTSSRNKKYSSSRKRKVQHYTQANVFVHNARGGRVLNDDAALAAWSVDAIRVVRDQLYRARNVSNQPLPFVQNWTAPMHVSTTNMPPSVKRTVSGPTGSSSTLEMSTNSLEDIDDEIDHDDNALGLPLWATEDAGTSSQEDDDGILITPSTTATNSGTIIISNLRLMAAEVEQLLDCMEVYMQDQRNRRSSKLKPPSRMKRQWYIYAVGFPAGFYLVYKLTKKHGSSYLAKMAFEKAKSLFAEHVEEPMKSIHRELFTRKEREIAADKKARMEAISSLKKMIKSWLDETFPDMPNEEKVNRANSMDMSLIEQTKEDNMKHIYNLNNVVRMSLIEMQFIKKEMMNALISMDELMAANEINMQVAAMTPAVVILYAVRYVFRKIFYALLKIGKSREETFGSFRHVMLDIERLLVMRDNPPLAPPLLSTRANTAMQRGQQKKAVEQQQPFSSNNMTTTSSSSSGECMLNSDDLGMVMLLVHQCRKILQEDGRRFSQSTIRNVSEDLAELAGERGAVTVRQQLQILSRMGRTYPFLKVVSTGVPVKFRVD